MLLIHISCVFHTPLCFKLTQAYIQRDTEISRDVHQEPLIDLNVFQYTLRRPIKAFHGLTDAGDYWEKTLRNVLVNRI